MLTPLQTASLCFLVVAVAYVTGLLLEMSGYERGDAETRERRQRLAGLYYVIGNCVGVFGLGAGAIWLLEVITKGAEHG